MEERSHTDSFEPFSLEDPKPKQFEIKEKLPKWAVPYLSSEKAWDNYSDPLVYEVDKRIREWIKEMRPVWRTKRGKGLDRRFQFATLMDIIGIEIDSEVRKNYQKIARIFAYYSSKVSKQTRIDGVKKKGVYTISPSRVDKQPYSLKLRMEEFSHEVDGKSMRLPVDDLEPGHARNPRTDANMQRRSEEGKRRMNEYKRAWSEKRASETGES